MPYAPTEYWKTIVKAVPDETLDTWISNSEESIRGLKKIASHGPKDSAIYTTIEMNESDLALYKEEKALRLAQKR